MLLGLTGMVAGLLNSYDRFGVFAISPFFWNVAIIVVLVAGAPLFPEGDEIYAYAIGVLVGTVVQLLIQLYDLRNTPFGIRRAVVDPFKTRLGQAFRNPDVRRVLLLMLPVTISLGLINFNLVINSLVGTLIDDPVVADRAPAAIDKAFRIYMLPQGIFSVAVATVLFPTLARFAARGDFDRLRSTMANGMRQILLLLAPATAAILVLSEPMTRLVYQRGEFDASQTDLVATALFWFAFSLPFNGLFLLMTRTFFSLQRPWLPTAISAGNLVITAGFAARALQGVRGRGDRRGDRDRDGRQRRRPGRGPPPPPRPARARPPRCGPRRASSPHRRRSPPSPTSPGTCSTTRSGAGLGGQIASLGHRARRRRASSTAIAVLALRIPEARQITAPGAPPRGVGRPGGLQRTARGAFVRHMHTKAPRRRLWPRTLLPSLATYPARRRRMTGVRRHRSKRSAHAC